MNVRRQRKVWFLWTLYCCWTWW